MKEKILNLLKSKTFFAVVINIVIMTLIIGITSFSYDSADDFYNSLYICQYHNYYNNEINYIFATITGSLQYILMNFNCFVLFQILLSCAAFSTLTFIFADKFGKAKSLIFTLVLNILFSFDHYSYILSSKTSALLLTAGFLIVLNSIRNKRYSLSFWTGVLEIIFGSFLCFKYFFVGLAFFIAYFIADMISKRKYKLPFRKFFWYFRPFVLVFVFVLLCGCGLEYYSYSVNNSDASTSQYYRYSQLTDYTDNNAFPEYSKYEKEFNAVGINSANEYELLVDGYYDEPNGLSTNALELVAEIQKQENPYNFFADSAAIFSDAWNHIVGFDSYLVAFAVILITMISFLVLHKKRFAFFPILYFATGFAACIYVRYAMDTSAYTMYGVLLMILSFTMFSFDFEHLKKGNYIFLSTKSKKTAAVAIAGLVIMCTCSGLAYYMHLSPVEYDKKPSDLYTEVDRHPENYYVLDPVTAKEFVSYTDNFTHPLWGFTSNFLKNVDGFGYLHQQSQLIAHNLPTNIYEAVADGKNTYVIDKNITFIKEKYLNQYYGQKDSVIAYNDEKEFNGFTIYNVKRHKIK